MQFLVFLHGARPTLLQDMTPEEERTAMAHFDHVKEAFKEGSLLMAGRRADFPLGIEVIEAESEEAARKFVEADPAIVKGLFTYELHPFRLALFPKLS
jgi:uncharacterized protein